MASALPGVALATIPRPHPLPLSCHVTDTCALGVTISSISPTVDEHVAFRSDIVKVTGTRLDRLNTLQIGSTSYRPYRCPLVPIKVSPIKSGPIKRPLAHDAAATCDPAAPVDLQQGTFAVYAGGTVIQAPTPGSGVAAQALAGSQSPASAKPLAEGDSRNAVRGH